MLGGMGLPSQSRRAELDRGGALDRQDADGLAEVDAADHGRVGDIHLGEAGVVERAEQDVEGVARERLAFIVGRIRS